MQVKGEEKSGIVADKDGVLPGGDDIGINAPAVTSEAERSTDTVVIQTAKPPRKIYGIPTPDKAVGRYTRLTVQQQRFVQSIISGKGKSESYREAYNSTGNDMTVAVSASKLLKNPKVRSAIASATEAMQENVIQDSVRTRQYVMEQLLAKCRDGKTEAVQLKALELMGRAVSMFSDRVEQTIEHIDTDKLKDELRAHLVLIDGSSG
jgi:phage terminase small subunit